MLSFPLAAQNVFTSTQSGDWDDCATWGGNNSPDHGDTVTIASGHTITVQAGTFEVGSVNFANATSKLNFAGTTSILRYTNTDRGYTAPSCCTTTQPNGVPAPTHSAGSNTTYEGTLNANSFTYQHYKTTSGDKINVVLQRPATLPDGAIFKRWHYNFSREDEFDFDYTFSSPTGTTTTFTFDRKDHSVVQIAFYLYYDYTDRDGCNTYNAAILVYFSLPRQ